MFSENIRSHDATCNDTPFDQHFFFSTALGLFGTAWLDSFMLPFFHASTLACFYLFHAFTTFIFLASWLCCISVALLAALTPSLCFFLISLALFSFYL